MDLRLLDKALYFVSMPGYNKSSTSINPDPKSDYYCGANAGKPSTNTSAEGGRGNYCPELDVLEANKFAVQSTCTDHGFAFCVVFSSFLPQRESESESTRVRERERARGKGVCRGAHCLQSLPIQHAFHSSWLRRCGMAVFPFMLTDVRFLYVMCCVIN